MIRSVKRSDVEKAPYLLWNTFVQVLSEKYQDLAPGQRPAHLVFVYESEVQNGGHFQYFENQGTERLQETIGALELLGAKCQKEILEEAGMEYLSRTRNHPRSAAEFVEEVLEGEFTEFDSRFGECSPSLIEILEETLHANCASFIQIQ